MTARRKAGGSRTRTRAVPLPRESREALERFQGSIRQGHEWPAALLETISLWTAPEEVVQGRRFRYLLHGEAFDWLLLSERLTMETDGLISLEEKERLLFYGRLPESVGAGGLRQALSGAKYRAHLNFWYGVVVEEALALAVEDEVRKEYRSKGMADPASVDDQVHQRLYGDSQETLLDRFRQEMGYPARNSMTLTGLKEFTYWLFKLRLRQSDQARVASDTRKGLQQLASLHDSRLQRP